ncbi:hypothetical protein P3X46_009161 [Hevea brasiliensis]|uniref:VQ domain-containing protein n=1 Tax=Hevea brasiliensis TaxID=3981 RepID=A0ABQ9MQ28_HEVBR|nr:sigma factor binding protein 1, chloroplastic-like [Hevea brasiliensis]KAJ9180984.1 hypothetical protein P3X46_009161 [Hevea brasiliensis]
MDNLGVTNSSLQERKATKKSKANKKKPMKVVYISNPVKFKTCASKFRALVQKLTGQDAELPDPSRFTDNDSNGGGGGGGGRYVNNLTVPDNASKTVDDLALEVPTVDLSAKQLPETPDAPPHPLESSFDDIFMPQMLQNFSGLLPSSLLSEYSANVN